MRASNRVMIMLAVLTGAGTAAAQTPAPPAVAPPPAASTAPAASNAAPSPSSAPAAPPPAAAAAPPALAPAPAPDAPPAASASASAPPPAAPSVLDKISADAFVDAYGNVNWNFPKPQAPAPGGTPGVYRAFDLAQGFALNWAGVNATYAADPIGATVSLRFGPGVTNYNTGSEAAYGLQYVKQAYATWKPGAKLTLDLGKFDQLFGSEVADSQLNINYTRSLLFTYAQPLFFTGIRADYAVSDMLDVKLIAVDGWNNTIDNNRGKSFGAQVMIKPADPVVLYIGYVGGPEQPDYTPGAGMTPPGHIAGANSNWRHLVDFVADINPSKNFRALLNADYGTEQYADLTESWYGANLALRYQATDEFAVALRGEVFDDTHGRQLGLATTDDTTLESFTLTLNYAFASHMAFYLDNRVDMANQAIFIKSASDTSKSQFTTTLGVIASTK